MFTYAGCQVTRPWESLAARVSLACAAMMLSEVLLGAEFTDMCDLLGVSAAAAESARRQVTLPEYPLWCDTALTSHWFAAPSLSCSVLGVAARFFEDVHVVDSYSMSVSLCLATLGFLQVYREGL